MLNKKRKAFTLAEVLITLGIIGVVAAMTIPTLMNSTDDQQNKVAYKKAMSIRERALKGEDFNALAAELSEDPSARDYEEIPGVRKAYKGNKGELGYFSVFDMVYPFETGAYNTEVGSISMPIRSSFGYHIIKVNSKTPASGYIRAAHIFLAVDPKTLKKLIRSLR